MASSQTSNDYLKEYETSLKSDEFLSFKIVINSLNQTLLKLELYFDSVKNQRLNS